MLTYVYKKRVAGEQVWITIGKHGSPWTPETARRQAVILAAEAARGINQADIKRVQKAKLAFAEAADLFIEAHGKKLKPRSREEYARLIRMYLKPAFGTLKIDAVTRSNVARAHTSWSTHPRAANHALAVLSKLWSWCEDNSYVPAHTNPCRRIDKYKEASRERYLSASEIERLMTVLDDLDAAADANPFVTAAIRLLLLTGARLTEITTLRWQWVDLERATLWLPDSKTGRNEIRLNPQALA